MTAPVAEPPGEIRVQPLSLAARVLAVVKAVGVVEKDKRNEFHRYDYASIEGVVDAVHDALADQGILWLGGTREWTDRDRQTNQGVSVVTTVEIEFEFIDTHTGESVQIPWLGRGDDPADKGIAKALTDARKTFIIQQLNLRRGEDTEADPATDERAYAPTGTVNMTEAAKGMTNAQLNQALVSVGLPAQEKPWGTFMRVPAEKVAELREALQRQ